MSWLEGRLPKWGPFGGGSTAVLEREDTPEAEALVDSNSPKLMVMVNDASGFACFKTHTFPDAQSATEFVLYWFRHETEGFSAFWAMTEEPSDPLAGSIAEPLVMIKDAQRVDVVYSFSFVDIESARAFVKDEVEHGTDREQITLYWALPVRLVTDAHGKAMLSPSVPWGLAPEAETTVETTDMWAAHETPTADPTATPDRAAEQRGVLQEAPDARTGIANGMSVGQETFELTSWIERARKRPKSSEPRDEAPSSRPSYESRFDYRKADETTFEPRSFAREMQRAGREERIDHEVLGRDEIEAPAVTPESPEVIEAVEAEPVAEAVMGEVPNALAAGVVFEEAVAEAVAEGGLAEAAAKPADAPAIEAGQDEAVADTLVLLEEAEPEPAVEESVLEVVEAESVVAPAPEAEERAQPLEELEERLEASTDHIEVEVEAVALPAQAEAEARSDEPTESDNSKAGFISIEPFDIVVHTNGHSKVEPSEPPSEVSDAPEAHVQAGAGETEDDETGQTFDIRIDIQLKSSRAMNVKRWEVKENPFDGFKSPPGRF